MKINYKIKEFPKKMQVGARLLLARKGPTQEAFGWNSDMDPYLNKFAFITKVNGEYIHIAENPCNIYHKDSFIYED
jgi:hypothetical protein